MKRNFLLFLTITLMMISSTYAQDYAVALKISTLGGNFELVRSFGSDFNVRLGAAYFTYNAKGGGGAKEDFVYTGELKLFTVSALGDWFIFGGNTFRITAGAMINLNQGDLVLTPTETYTMGGTTYSPADLGTVDAVIDFNKVAPYMGIGFGNPTGGESGLGFSFDIGAIYQGSPKAKMNSEGLLQPTAEQAPILQENIKWFRFYPVVSLGLTYKF